VSKGGYIMVGFQRAYYGVLSLVTCKRKGMNPLNTPVVLVCCHAFATPLIANIDFPDFSSMEGLNLVGDAAQFDGRLRLTPSAENMTAWAWFASKQRLQTGFTTTFEFQITDIAGLVHPDSGEMGADGIAFVIQNWSPLILGETGGLHIGYTGLRNSVAIEFDTWWNNGGVSGDQGDLNGNHVSVHTNGTEPNSAHHDFSLASTSAIPDLSDGGVHIVRIEYAPGMMLVFIDNLVNPALEVTLDLATILSLDAGQAWIGFTSATGAAYENHDILNWTLEVVDCNLNGIDDAEDLSNCDGSPWCSDCNDNGILDECDVAEEKSYDLTSMGSFIGKIFTLSPPHPLGFGNHDPEVMRDHDYPPVGSGDNMRQYDTFHNGDQGDEDWLGYEFPEERVFTSILFQEGKHFSDGGWFDDLHIQVWQNDAWTDVSVLATDPTYPGNNGISYELFIFKFDSVFANAIRIYGDPGGDHNFISMGEFRVAGSTSHDCNGIATECEFDLSDVELFIGLLLAENPDPVLVCVFDQTDDGFLNGEDIQPYVDILLQP